MDAIVSTIGVLLAGYVVGSFPTAYLLTRRLKGVDIRTVGSRNPGAINVFHIVGPWGGITVLAVDALKGAAVLLAIQAMDGHDAAIFAGALGTVVGHNWPIFLRFRGGKGVAVIFGLSLAVIPLWTLVALGVALAVGLATRSVIFGIAWGIVAVNVLTVATGQGTMQVGLCLTLSAIVIATHYGLAYRGVVAAVRRRGVWGFFESD